MKVHGEVKVTIKESDPDTGKEYLELIFPGGTTVNITTNIAEMIGGIGAGIRNKREEREYGH